MARMLCRANEDAAAADVLLALGVAAEAPMLTLPTPKPVSGMLPARPPAAPAASPNDVGGGGVSLAGGVLLAWKPQFRRHWGEVKMILGAVARSPRMILSALAIAWLALTASFTATWLIATALGIPVHWYEVAGTTVISYTVTLLPISLNGYGVREVTIAGLYGVLGATAVQAVTLALITRFLMMSMTLPGALWVSEGVVLRQKQP